MNKKQKKKRYLNIGCGGRPTQSTKDIEWVNIDKYLVPPGGIQADAKDLPFEKETFDYVLCDQLLEHIEMADILTVLQEIKRVLKKGGTAIIAVPEFKSAIKDFMSYDWDKYFNPFQYQWMSEVIYGGQNHEGEFHKTPMTPGFLHYALNMVGLTKHNLIMHPKDGKCYSYPGTGFADENARLRNAQLIAEIIK